MSADNHHFSKIASEFSSRIRCLQEALRECLEASLPALDGARACARALGLKHDLGWKIYAISTCADLPSTVAALPRRAGWLLVLQSLRKANCPPRKLAALEEAIESVLSLIESGTVGRPMLRVLAAGGLNSDRETSSLRRARRAMRRSCEELYGVHCQAQVSTCMVGPPDRQGRIDVLMCVEHEGLMRLRPGFPVSIQRLSKIWNDKSGLGKVADTLGTSPQHGWLIDDLSTPGIWGRHLRLIQTNGGPMVLFESDTEGATDPIRAVFADYTKRAGKVGTEDDAVDLQFVVSVPVAHGVAEVWLHRSIECRSEPVVSLLGGIDCIDFSGMPTGDVPHMPLPLEASVTKIDSPDLPAPLRAMSDSHVQVVCRGAQALRSEMSEFVGFRLMLPDVAIGMRLAMRWRM